MNDNNYIDWKYTPENSDDGYVYTWNDVLNIAKGNEKLAMVIIDECRWQYPETELDQLIIMGEVVEYNGKYELTYYNDQLLENLWSEFSDIPIVYNDEHPDGALENDWLCFESGTERFDIWEWFDERHSKGVYFLMFPGEYK